MTDPEFVPADYVVPRELATDDFRLEPLAPEHNAGDHAAWTGSIDHIRATPGFEGRGWPPVGGMSPEANLADLQRHADDFARRRGFTYSVIEPRTGEVIGCVYIYPARSDEHDATVRSWVRAMDRRDGVRLAAAAAYAGIAVVGLVAPRRVLRIFGGDAPTTAPPRTRALADPPPRRRVGG